MSEPQKSEQNQSTANDSLDAAKLAQQASDLGVPADASPEEIEAAAAQAAAEQEAAPDPLVVALAEVATLKAKCAELSDQYLRGQADVQNARRRADDEITKARKFAVEAFAESLLPEIGRAHV